MSGRDVHCGSFTQTDIANGLKLAGMRLVIKQTFLEVQTSVPQECARGRASSDFDINYSQPCGEKPGASQRQLSPSQVSTADEDSGSDSESSRSSRDIPMSARVRMQIGKPSTMTTVVLRNLPHGYTRDLVCELLSKAGFDRRYDFVHVPVDFCSWLSFGHAFVNMSTHEDALNLMQQLEGFKEWDEANSNSLSIAWSSPLQGLEQNLEHYRNSPVMNNAVHEQYKPLYLIHGVRTPLPKPTKRLRFPRGRHSSQYSQLRAKIEQTNAPGLS